MRLRCTADRLPAGVAAFHVLRVEAGLAQRNGGATSDMKSVDAEHDDRIGLRQLAHPLLQALRVAPRGAVDDVLSARNVMPWTCVDESDRRSGVEHHLHLLDADA